MPIEFHCVTLIILICIVCGGGKRCHSAAVEWIATAVDLFTVTLTFCSHLVMKTPSHCFTVNKNKCTIHIHPSNRISADKARPGLSWSDLVWPDSLTEFGSLAPTLCPLMSHRGLRAAAFQPLQDLCRHYLVWVEASTQSSYTPFFLVTYDPSSSCQVYSIRWETLELERQACIIFWPASASLPLSFHQDGVTACHRGCSTIRLRPPQLLWS